MPVAFIEEVSETQFTAERCDMISLEVVVRREAHGSFLKRYPEFKKGRLFPKLLLEFFLKTSGKKYGEIDLPKDDPLMLFEEDRALLYLPDQPMYQQTPFHVLNDFPLKGSPDKITEIGDIAIKTFLILEKAWQLVGRRLVDFKVEFGINPDGKLRLADEITNDSWRVLEDGQYIDKQLYRDNVDLNTVTTKYRLVSELTGSFNIPRQQLILWRASENDGLKLFDDAIADYCPWRRAETGGIKLLDDPASMYDTDIGWRKKVVTCSLHKEPIRACEEIQKIVQEVPDSVIIVFCGRSNGAGPTLSAQCTVPIITVPATWREFPEDVWSSLRTPSDVPVSTILEPKNAVLHALQILAMRNPLIYAELRLRQEKRLCNFMMI